MPRGVEFAGGTVVIVQFDQRRSVEQVRTALDSNFPGGGQNAIVQPYGDPAQRQVMIRVPQVGAEAGRSLSTHGRRGRRRRCRRRNLGNVHVVGHRDRRPDGRAAS